MEKLVNMKCVEMTPEEIAKLQFDEEQSERNYWLKTPYKVCVSNMIHERYSYDDEIAIIRQEAEKPEEYQAYFDYCEQCKAFVKQKKGEYADG